VSIWPIDDDTPDEEPLHCPGCPALGDAPCEPGCVYADPPDAYATAADVQHDEQTSSDRDPPDDPWEDIF